MSKKHKWIFGVGGLIGLVGIGFFFLNRHLNLVSLSSMGGASNRGLNSRGLNPSGKRMELGGDSLGSLDLGNLGSSGGLQSLELNPNLKFKFLGDGFTDSFDIFSSSSAIKNIFSEIFIEGQVAGIDKDILRTYEQIMSGQNLQEHVKNFQSIKKKIQDWIDQGGLQKKRERGKFLEEPKLTAEERTALRNFYYIFAYLTQHSQHFHSKLYDASKDSSANLSDTLSVIKAPELREVQWSLNAMQWDREKTKVQVKYLSPTGTFLPPRPDKKNSYGWTNWNRNPFKHFFDSQEEFEKIMEEADSSQQALEDYIASKRTAALFAFAFGVSPETVYGDLSRFQKGITGSETIVEYQVARKLLEWMGKVIPSKSKT